MLSPISQKKSKLSINESLPNIVSRANLSSETSPYAQHEGKH